MIKKILFLLIVFIPSIAFSQVGINTENPNSLTVLDVTLTLDGTDIIPKGVMLPRMTEEQRDKIDVTNLDLANSLLVYNTDDDCFNYFSKVQKTWVSLCGSQSKEAIFSIDCDQTAARGIYTINTGMNSSNYLEMVVVVTRAGTYNISGITANNNGYYFSLIGEFVETGTFILQIPAFGIPKAFDAAGDKLLIRNSNQLVCDNVVVTLRQAIYDVDCSTVVVRGNYISGVPLTDENYVEGEITADPELAGYTYKIRTTLVNGYSFTGTGTLVAGKQTVRATGSGTPEASGTDKFEFKNNSMKDSIPSCDVEIKVDPRPVKILGVASTSYNIANSKNLTNMALNNPDYFGLDASATYHNTGFEFTSVSGNGKMDANIKSVNPDIIFTQYSYVPTASDVTALTNFVKNGGALIYCTDRSTNQYILSLIQSMFDGNTAVTLGSEDKNDDVVTLENSGTKITNGPFNPSGHSSLAGLGMLRDAGGNFGLDISNLPMGELDVIAYSNNGESVRMLAHKTKGFVFVGDGGPFGATNNSTSASYNNPAKFDTVGGKTTAEVYTGIQPDSYNSFLFLNTIAWAIDYVKNSGKLK